MNVARRRRTSAEAADHGPSGFANRSVMTYAQWMRPIVADYFPARVMLFVVLFFLYLYSVVDVRLDFPACDILFLWNVRYFTDFVGQPGSLMIWTDNLLVQLCYLGWPGAIVLATSAWLLLVSTIGFMNVLGRARIGGTWAIPAILVTALYGSYTFPRAMLVGLALAVTTANVWCRLPVRRPGLRLAAFATISVALYYVVGEAYYGFAACCVIHEALAEKRRIAGVLFALAALAVKYGLDALLAHVNLASNNFHVLSLVKHASSQLTWSAMILYGYFPACALLVVYRQAVFASIRTPFKRYHTSGEKANSLEPDKAGRHGTTVHPDRVAAGEGILEVLRWTCGTVLVLAPAAAAGLFFLDRESKSLLGIQYCAEHRLWDALLEEAATLPIDSYSSCVNHDVNLALYHTGRLPYQMFSYPQIRSPFLDMPDGLAPSLIRKPNDLLFELGRVAEAERLSLEMLERWPSGGAIKRLALIKMVKGQSAAASVFLKVLRDDLIWGRWAEEQLQRLATDPELAGDEEIQRARRLMISKDDFQRTYEFRPNGRFYIDPGEWFLSLLKHNSENRMAFEYLMAICLQMRNVQAVTRLSSHLDDITYKGIPPLYEEAAIICLLEHPDRHENVVKTNSEVFFRGQKISVSTMNRFRRFQAIVSPFGGINEKADSAVARELGDSYFYYYYFSSRKRS
jgi:hypothetical protein